MQQIHGNLQPAPAEYNTWSPPRGKHRRIDVNGQRLRFASVRAAKIMDTRAPVTPCPVAPTKHPTFPWSSKLCPDGIPYKPVMNIDCLLETVVPAMREVDPALATTCISRTSMATTRPAGCLLRPYDL